MADDKIIISQEELNSSRADRRVKEQEALARNRRYAQMKPEELAAESAPTTGLRRRLWYTPAFSLAIFGLLGALLAWAGGEVLNRPDPREQAAPLIDAVHRIRATQSAGRFSATQAGAAVEEVRRASHGNPYLRLFLDDSLAPADREQRREELDRVSRFNALVANLIAYGLCGVMIAVCLSVAEPVVDRNLPAAVRNGAVGATLGLVGGLAAAVAVDWIYRRVGGEGQIDAQRRLAARVASFALLGCTLSVAPGLVMMNPRRLVIGIVGGLLGGAIGGALFEGVTRAPDDAAVDLHLSRLVALAAIGVTTGAATGLIERAARTGWLKVTRGLIAGKQFILYRNPTFIGSAPDCQVYLFKDPQVGRRHAAIHVQRGAFEIEDLPMGGETLVNGEPVRRKKLKHGDQIRVGASTFLFQERGKRATQ